MGITGRQTEILDGIVEEYIVSARPVSSQLLEKRYDFGICPASIRIEMQKLTDKGFIHQLHTSAGRVPTDKGYRFFVDNLLAHLNFPQEKFGGLKKEISEFEKVLKEEKGDIFKLASRLTKFLAEESSSFIILNLLERDFLWKEGWEGILQEPEFEEKDLLFDFAELLENFEKNIKNLKIDSKTELPQEAKVKMRTKFSLPTEVPSSSSPIKVYIGKENPFPKAKDFSIISTKCCVLNAGEGIISLLGPKRMAYERNISLINSLTEALAEAREE